MAPWQDAVAVQDFGPAYDRYGSFASDMIVRIQRGMSASPRKQTSRHTSRQVRFAPHRVLTRRSKQQRFSITSSAMRT